MSTSKLSARVLLPVAAIAIAGAAAYPHFSARLSSANAGRMPVVAPIASSVSSSIAAARGGGSPGAYEIGGLSSRPSIVPKAGEFGAMGTYLVTFRDAPLAKYRGGVPGIAVPKRALSPGGRMRLDVKSAEAGAYVEHLRRAQGRMEREIAKKIGTSLPVRSRMQHALNAIVVDLTPAQAARVAGMPGVLRVEPERELQLSTDVGPNHIGATPVWNGTNPGAPNAYQGEGMVVGIIDTGINFGSPSFAATDPVDGYVHTNPFGSGVFVGTCVTGGVDQGRCNNKLIGGYDFVCGAPANQCGQPNVRDEPSFGDTNGHGTHVASTAAGNRRNVMYGAAPLRISGVAPRANIIAYDTCYTNTSTGVGSCPSSSTAAAINQAVADGVVDAINYSIGGGSSPWSDSVSMAMLGAVDAGIFVAAAAGNDGPAANTLDHNEPWTSTVAAAQHGRGGFGILMSVTGPAPVPAAIATLAISPGTGGTELLATIPSTTPLRISPGINSTNDSCSALPANAFAGAIAVVRRGTCNLTIKANNVTAAGAVALLIANNTSGSQTLLAGGTSIPVFGVTQAEGDALRNFGNANPTATAQITYPAAGIPNAPDVLGAFSSRGPAASFDLIKPDITAPGVQVIAAYAGTTITGSESLVNILNGTSMASPHIAGAALLVRQARPTWTPPEVKSALLMTATPEVYLEDQITAATPHARGSGRARVDRAINAGLVLNETAANFQAANPGSGGNPATLNLPSLADATCASSCSFTRTFRNARTYGSLWRVQLVGLTGTAPALLWVPAGGSTSLTVTITTTGLPASGNWNFGKLVLTELFTGVQVNTTSELQLPIGVVVPAGGASATFVPGISAFTSATLRPGDAAMRERYAGR